MKPYEKRARMHRRIYTSKNQLLVRSFTESLSRLFPQEVVQASEDVVMFDFVLREYAVYAISQFSSRRVLFRGIVYMLSMFPNSTLVAMTLLKRAVTDCWLSMMHLLTTSKVLQKFGWLHSYITVF